jgi:hypothetical protein
MKKPSKTLSRRQAGGQAVTFTSAKRGFLSTAKIRMSAGRALTAPTIITPCREMKAKMRGDALRGKLSLYSRPRNWN